MADSGTPSPASPPPAPQAPNTPSLRDDMINTVMPQAADADPARQRRKIRITVAWVVVSSLVLFLLTKGTDWLTSEHDARVSSEADDKVDREGPAFSASVRQDTREPEATLFDAPFSSRDKARIVGTSGVAQDLTAFTKAHHGRGVFYSDVWKSAMGVDWWGYSEAWFVDLISDRKASLVVNGLRMKGVRCTPAKATTAIIRVGEGGADYDGLLFDVTRSTDTPLITGGPEEEHYGEPFFTHKKIDLGNGATPGGLRIQVTSGTQDCTWKAFEVSYVDAKGTHTQDITDNGKGFSVHGIAERPRQVYEHTVMGVEECAPRNRGRYTCPSFPEA